MIKLRIIKSSSKLSLVHPLFIPSKFPKAVFTMLQSISQNKRSLLKHTYFTLSHFCCLTQITVAPHENSSLLSIAKTITNYFQSTKLYMTLSPKSITGWLFVGQLSAFWHCISEESSTFFEAPVTHLFQIVTLSVISSGFQKVD